MVKDSATLEVGKISDAEAVAVRASTDFTWILEPMERVVGPWHLKIEPGNYKIRYVDGNDHVNYKRGAAGAINRGALCNSPKLANRQSVGWNAGGFGIIFF